MDSIKEKLLSFAHYYTINRGVGHTRAMIDGAARTPKAFVIVESLHSAQRLDPSIDLHRVVSMHNLSKLRGLRAPITFDNIVLQNLFRESASEISRLEKEVEKLKKNKNEKITLKYIGHLFVKWLCGVSKQKTRYYTRKT
jgi:hypothetical protein